LRFFKYITFITLILGSFVLNAQINISDSSKLTILGDTKIVGLESSEIAKESLSYVSENKPSIIVVGDVVIVGEFVNAEIVKLDETESFPTDKIDEHLVKNVKNSDNQFNNHSQNIVRDTDKKLLLSKVPLPKIFYSNYLNNNNAISFVKNSFHLNFDLSVDSRVNSILSINESIPYIDAFYYDYIKFHYPIRSPPVQYT